MYTSDASCCDYNQRGSEWISLSLFFQSHTFIYLAYLLSTYYVISTENTAMNKTDNKTRKLIYVVFFQIGLVIEGKEEGCFGKALRDPVKVRKRNIPAKTKVLGEWGLHDWEDKKDQLGQSRNDQEKQTRTRKQVGSIWGLSVSKISLLNIKWSLSKVFSVRWWNLIWNLRDHCDTKH